MTRSIMLANFGGKEYEKFECTVEGDDFKCTSAEVRKELHTVVEKYISDLPKIDKRLKDSVQPF